MIESKWGLDNTVSEVWKKNIFNWYNINTQIIHAYKEQKMPKIKLLPNDSLTSLVTSLTTILLRSVTETSKFFHSRRLPRTRMLDCWKQDTCKRFMIEFTLKTYRSKIQVYLLGNINKHRQTWPANMRNWQTLMGKIICYAHIYTS